MKGEAVRAHNHVFNAAGVSNSINSFKSALRLISGQLEKDA